MRQKLITLCPTTFEIALKMDNFSAWVRDQLMIVRQTEVKELPLGWRFEYECPVCHKLKDFPNQDMAWRCNKCNVSLNFMSVIV